jgi:hypothetical protein
MGFHRLNVSREDRYDRARRGAAPRPFRIPAVGETIVLLAHELQHVVEKTRGLDFEAESQRPRCGVWKAAGGYETQGAVDVTGQVSRELREAKQRFGSVKEK